MTALIHTFRSTPSIFGLLGSTTGWIGIDVGSCAIKLAQVERRGESWRIKSRWVIEHTVDEPISSTALANGELGKQIDVLKSSRRMFRGRRACATLPSSCVEYRALDLPTGPWRETRAILEQEISADTSAEQGAFEYDAWQAVPGDSMTKIMAVSAARETALRVASDLFSAGFDCSAIDAVPCAIARAVVMCDPAAADETVVAIDLGFSSALLTVVHQSRPAFCRTLRGCGLQALMQPLVDKLGITHQECRQLLNRFGIPSETAGAPAARSTYQVMSHCLKHMGEELRRTLSFARHQLRLSPKRIWLFGGGGTICNTAEFISEETEIPAAPWRLQAGDAAGRSSEPLFGVASGLSQLAWEAGKCT